MLNLINYRVKYVHNQRINSSIGGVNIYTVTYLDNILNIDRCIKSGLTQLLPSTFTRILSTTNKLINNLLNKSFTHNPPYLLIRLLKEN